MAMQISATSIRSDQNDNSDYFLCVGCFKKDKSKLNQFYWTTCNHQYCYECAINIINESLSFLNEIPKCRHPACNQSLHPQQAYSLNRLLLTKYNISNKTNISTHHRDEHLIYGYIRRLNRNAPKELILAIFDYYKLIYYTISICDPCKGTSILSLDCMICHSNGYTTDCKECESSGIYKYNTQCTTCQGSGAHITPCRSCSGSGIYRIGCTLCRGTGTLIQLHGYNQAGTSCFACNGTGLYDAGCTSCHRSGRYTTQCWSCHGNGCFLQQQICNICQGSGHHKADCTACAASGIYRIGCTYCNGDCKVVALDFNKLRRKQSLCNKCNNYFPNDMVMYWSKCRHVFCKECMIAVVQNEVNYYSRIPICSLPGCDEKFTEEGLKELVHVLDTDGRGGRAIYSWEWELESMLYRAYKFLCTKCGRWHLNEEKHYWSICGHEYGINCVKQMVIEKLGGEGLVINDQKGNIAKMPRCCYVDCNQPIQYMDVGRLKLTEYQLRSLRTLRVCRDPMYHWK